MYNEAKQEILAAVRTIGELTSMEISLITGRTPENSSMLLLKYHRMGLLSRRKMHGKTRGYSITERGLERLVWLESDEENE